MTTKQEMEEARRRAQATVFLLCQELQTSLADATAEEVALQLVKFVDAVKTKEDRGNPLSQVCERCVRRLSPEDRAQLQRILGKMLEAADG